MIWDSCNGPRHIGELAGVLHRLVESQEQIATLSYVDTLEEQAVLEDLLDAAKPPYPDACQGYHYLLKTPFRYPPLKWGSRFGRTHEPAIFYGGQSVATTLAESAYYRFVFWHSMDAPPVKAAMHSQHTMFAASYRSDRGVRLQDPPFDAHAAQLTHPRDYGATQALGTAMRESGVEAFEYLSARDPGRGICIGLFSPRALPQKKPRDTSQWLCELNGEEVLFKQAGSTLVHRYGVAPFLYRGTFPMPA